MRQLLPRPAEDLSDDDLLAAYATADRRLRVNFVSSADGSVSLRGRSGGLSGPADKRVFALLRDVADVVLVAAGTVRSEGYGYPDLSARRRRLRTELGLAELPTFAILSRSLYLDLDSSLFTGPPVRTVVLTSADPPADRRAALAERADVVPTADLAGAVAALHERGLTRILCEGGPVLFASLLAAGLVDELCLTLSPLLAGPGAGRIVAGVPHPPVGLAVRHLLEEDGVLFLRYAVDDAVEGA